MEIKPSIKLLKKVYEDRNVIGVEFVSKNLLEISYTPLDDENDVHYFHINIYELVVDKLKGWASQKDYYLMSGKSCYDGYKCFNDNGTLSPFVRTYTSEVDAVLEACEWIANK